MEDSCFPPECVHAQYMHMHMLSTGDRSSTPVLSRKPAASATVPRGQWAETRHGALPAALPGGTAGPDDYRMLA